MSLPRARTVLVVLAALAVMAFGITRLAASTEDATVVDRSTVDDLTAQITAASWTNMDHDMSSDAPGYKMPPQMMPGMPEDGHQRLAVHVTVVNTGDRTRPLRPDEEFSLRAAKEDGRWKPRSDTFGELPRLPAGNAVNGIIFFDLPPDALADSPAWIEWTHGDTASRLTLPLDGASSDPGHSHNP